MAPPPHRRFGWRAWLFAVLGALLLAGSGGLWWLDTPSGHRFLAERISSLEPESGLRIGVGQIDGSIYKRTVLRNVSLGDPQGRAAFVPVAYLDWYPLAWLSNRLDIDRLYVPEATLIRLPKFRPSGAKRPILPNFDIRLGRLRVDRLHIGPAIAGTPRTAYIDGRADIRSGRAIVALRTYASGSGDILRLALDSRPDDNRFDLEAQALGPKGGILARVTGLEQGFYTRITGKGDWTLWRGDAIASVAGRRPSHLDVEARKGRIRLKGTIEPEFLPAGLVRRLAVPRANILAEGTMENRIVTGTLAISSDTARLDAVGGIDLGRSGFDNLVLTLSPRRGSALVKGLRSDGLLIRARLAGPFDSAAFDYVIRARSLAQGTTRIDGLLAEGSGRLNPDGPTYLPLSVRATRVSLNNAIVDDVLTGLSVKGVVQLNKGRLSSTPIAIRSKRIKGQVVLLGDLNAGRITAAFLGDVSGVEVPGLGRVDVQAKADVTGGGQGGFRVVGRVRAAMRRLDNGFLQGLGQGLPVADSGLSLGANGRLNFTNLKIAAPALTLSAEGYRAPDGSFHFRGSGRHRSYGPLRLSLDGRIDRPRVDLVLASPMPAAGLANVHAVLTPDATGYAFVADGGSRLGPFTATGAILLPARGPTFIRVERLAVGDMLASGLLQPEKGGLVGTLDVSGAVRGPIRLSLVEDVQQITLDLNMQRAQFTGTPVIVIGQGRLRGTILLRPGATTIDMDAQGRGIRYGTVRIGRLAASAHLVNDSGTVTASIAGQRGRVFDLQTRATFSADSIVLDMGGTLDRVPINLSGSAVLSRSGADWSLAPVTISYRGGSIRLSGRYGPAMTHVEAQLGRVPLSLLDLANSDLALGGLASGSAVFDTGPGRQPTGRLEMRVRGLTRAGLALGSTPVDVGLNAELTESRAAMRAVIASGGKVTGRAQALATPLGQGTLAERLNAAPLRAQLRYNGNADTLWRLMNVELFSLSGPAVINADVAGTLADPRISGTVATDNATLQSPVTGMSLTNMATRGTFDGSTLVLSSLSARTRGGGSLDGAGRFTFSAERGIGIDLSARLDHATVLDRDDIGATVSGPIRIQSEGNGGLISGTFTVNTSRFTLGRAAAVATIPELRVIEVNGRRSEDEPQRPVLPWRLAIKADVPNRLNVTGLGMQSEWSADLDIGGTITSPVLTGTADLIRGDYDFAGKRFELREGRLRFAGQTPIDPSLAITAVADVNSISATINVTGTSAKPIISFTSVPALPQEELLSRILFGTSVTSLSAPEALQLASAVAAFQGGGGGLDPINAVRKATGLSRLRILPADVTLGRQTAVAAGKNFGRSIYVELITDGQGYSATSVEYQITRWLSLLSTVSTVGRQSANVRVTKDY